MRYGLYSIKDKLMDYTGPLLLKDDEVAKRFFASKIKELTDKEYSDAKYFDLYKVGEFESETAKITPVDIPELIAEGDNT